MGRDRQDFWHAAFQRAALDPSQWISALELLASETGSAHAQLIGIGGKRTIPFNWVTNYSAAALQDFVDIGGASPQLNFRIAADIGASPYAVRHEQDYDRVRPALRGDAYLDYCRDQDIPFGCHTALTAGDDGLIGLALLRSRSNGRTTEAQRAEFRRATEAARAAVHLQLAMESSGKALVQGTLEAIAVECFLLDAQGAVGGLTPDAEARAAEGSLLCIADGILSSPVPELARAIRLALTAIAAGAACRSVRLTGGFGPSLNLFQLQRREWALQFQPQIIAVVRDPLRRLEGTRGAIMQEFGLTRAEAEIALMLGQGMPREGIAARRGVALMTLRSQIKSIYEKTGCRRESELVGLLFRLVL